MEKRYSDSLYVPTMAGIPTSLFEQIRKDAILIFSMEDYKRNGIAYEIILLLPYTSYVNSCK